MAAGLAEGLLSRLLVAVPPVMEVTTEAVSSKGSAGTVALEEAEEDEDKSRPAANVPCLSGEEVEEAGEEADEEEEEEEDDGDVVEARTGAVSLGSRRSVTSGSSVALVEAGLGLGLGAGVGAGRGAGSGVEGGFSSVGAGSTGSSTPQSAWRTTSP